MKAPVETARPRGYTGRSISNPPDAGAHKVTQQATAHPAALPVGRAARRGRRLGQVIVRGGVLLALAVGALYITLPWWLPSGLLRNHIAEELREATGLNVHIGEVSLSWGRGLIIQDLAIEAPPGFEQSPMIRARSVQGDFSPIDLLGDEMEWMEIEGLRVTVEQAGDGRINLQSLQDLDSDFDLHRLSVRNATVVVAGLEQAEPLELVIHDLQLLRGRDDRLTGLSVIGQLLHGRDVAPVSLQLIGDDDAPDRAAEAHCQFENINLLHLPLPKNFPLKALAGRCRGRLGCTLTKRGRVDGFELTLQASQLQVTPAHGETLPDVEDARLEISGDYDAFSERIDIHTASIHLPGVHLQGRASVYPDVIAGRPEALEAARLQGTVQPGQLRALLTGQTEPAGAVNIQGPVALQLDARRDAIAERLTLDLALQADAADIRQGGQVLKPAGLPTSLKLQADVDDRTGQLELRLLSLLLGENVLTAEAGSLTDVVDVLNNLNRRHAPPDAADCLEALSHASMRGTLKLCDATVLADALGLAPEALATRGELRGTWSLTRGQPCWLRVGMESPAAQPLTVGELFDKPAGEPLRVDLTAALHGRQAAIRDVQVDILAGTGVFRLRDGQFQVSESPRSQPTAQAQFTVERIEGFLGMLPALGRNGIEASGKLTGRLGAVDNGETAQAVIRLDAAGLDLQAGDMFHKPARQPLRVQAAYTPHPTTPQATFTAEAAGLDAHAEWQASDAGPTVRASLSITDLASLPSCCPTLAKWLDGGKMGGTARIDIHHESGLDAWQLELQGRNLACRRGTDTLAIALENVSFDLLASVRPLAQGNALAVTVDGLKLTAPGLDIHQAGGTLQWRPDAARRDHRNDWLAGVDNAQLTFDLRSEPAKFIQAAVPRARQSARQMGLGGETRGTLRLEVDREGLVGELHMNADALSFDAASFVKPPTLPARLSVLASRRRQQLAPLVCEQLTASLGEMKLHGDARWPVARGTGEARWHARLDVPNAGEALALLPTVREQGLTELAGQLQADARWQGAPEQLGRAISSLTLNVGEVRGTLRDLPIELDGTLSLEALTSPEPGRLQLERLETSDLAFRAGQSRGWLLADVTQPLRRPGGWAHVLFDTLDDRELARWIGDSRAVSDEPLSETQQADLERRARAFVARLRQVASWADATLRVTARQYQAYDPVVDKQYDLRNLHLQARAQEGQLSLAYDAGLYGGTMHQSMDVRLTQDVPWVERLTTYREVAATEEIRPQISMTFPGNTVRGTFSRTEEVGLSLQQMIANAMDPRYRPVLVGKAKLVATDGVVVGRAAPHFVTRIFPGLNLTEYHYDRMTGFTTFLPDGSQANETLFTGVYDVYMEGTTDADNFATYTLGLVLLPGRVSHEWHREWRQGRFPILKIKGTIRDGQLVDEEVSYPWPNETLFEVFLQNNIVYRAWLNFRTRKDGPNESSPNPQR